MAPIIILFRVQRTTSIRMDQQCDENAMMMIRILMIVGGRKEKQWTVCSLSICNDLKQILKS